MLEASQGAGTVVAELRVQIMEEDADAEHIGVLAVYLRAEFLRLDVEHVELATSGTAPPGSRGSEVSAVGGLLVTMGQAAGSLRTVISTITDWLKRSSDPDRSVCIEIDGDKLTLSHASPADQERLIALFVGRHSGGGEQGAGSA
jgi:hypothetical protein